MSGPPSISLARFLGLVTRELQAASAELAVESDEESPTTLLVPLRDGRSVVVRFDAPLADRDGQRERLAALVESFEGGVLEAEAEAKPERVPIPLALHEELRDLAARAGATDAVVIDAHSPVVWGSANVSFLGTALVRTAEVDDALAYAERTSRALLEAVRKATAAAVAQRASDDDAEALGDRTQRALRHLRTHPGLEQLRRGRVFRERVVQEGPSGAAYLAHSLGTIYVLVLVYDGDFDELRAERALHDGLARVERLVLALPPLDPDPSPLAGVVRLARRRRS